MNLQSVHIYRSYGKPEYQGKITFGGPLGEITLMLDDEFSRELFKVCADQLVKVSRDAAEEMTATIIDAQAKALEPPKEEDT